VAGTNPAELLCGIAAFVSYPRKRYLPFWKSSENKGSKRQVHIVPWSAYWVGFYPPGRWFCPLGAIFNGQRQLPAFFDLFSCIFSSTVSF
jgi:hypothetical protein